MRITIVTIGTRGDVQPYIALALGLQANRHTVTICTHDIYKSFVESYGVNFTPLAGDIRSILESDEGKLLLTRRSRLAGVRDIVRLAAPVIRQLTQDIITATQDSDLILGSTLGYFNAKTAAQVNKVPLIFAGMQCFTPTSAYVSASMPALPLGALAGGYNRFSYSFINWLLYGVSSRMINGIRRDLTGLPPLNFRGYFDDLVSMRQPALYGFSETVLPRPREWTQQIHITGFWFLDQQNRGWQPSDEVLRFLDAGSPPVYIGFGSMSDRDPEQVAQIALDALGKSGQRGILLSGWQGMKPEALSDNVLLLDSIPHDWLFPRMAAVVHHGGLGTTSAALRAGAPQVVVPFNIDQPFWGRRMVALGTASDSILRKELSADRLATAITRAVKDERIKQCGAQIREKLRAEDGVARAVEIIERL